ncbi:glutamate-ammonia-ligase adenylyltransferase [Balnearium lithotrophicum]|uniref:Glutamate-ammonia-ligase adenylyltransferase n=1 Tax=Balnearium lithotrophicum TaxID=223788 RepID=A0A521AJB8_9BACT|nr:glutamate-ammonia-ligase adenylyltransferase [Balnearium lithotrophicum]SMO34906.1 glutamate-ammonia-ligase adenylyltransferase [Balnearium lithotrophicum]
MNFLLEKLKCSLNPEWLNLVRAVEERQEEFPNPRRALLFIEKLSNRLNCQFSDYLHGDFGFHLLLLFSYSQFLGEFLINHVELIEELRSIYRETFLPSDFRIEISTQDRRKFIDSLRVYKNLQIARVVLRDILHLAPFLELVRDTTLIHDACIKAAYDFAYRNLVKKYGKPSSNFIVVDMGKAGGFELNYSSDVDVIYVYGSRYGETEGGTYGKLQNHDFFTLLSREITELLSERTKEGICFVVDTRLRPNGSMGPLTNDIEALEQYYTAVARPWERIALLKARPSAGDIGGVGLEFLELANLFVYRKYIDLSLIEEVLRIKEMIRAKVSKKGGKIDLKLGKGGIREIEFIVQAFQVIYGGKYPQIRSKNTVVALKKLLNWGFLNRREYEELLNSYIFLRRAEHMLQVTNFRQTQTFHPESEEAEELSKKLGFKSRDEFLRELSSVMKRVNYYFNRFFPTKELKPLSSYTVEELERFGFKEPEEIKRFIDALFDSKSLSVEKKRKLDVLGTKLLKLIYEAPVSKTAIKNLLLFLETEEGQVFFFSVLSHENLLKLLIYLLSTKDFFLKRFRKSPEVLEHIFSPELIESPVNESSMEEFFKELQNLQLLKNTFEIVSLLRKRLGRTRIEEFFSELTSICDFCLKRRYEKLKPKFAVSSLGKCGSREMNVGSDLDLLFISKEKVEDETERAVDFVKSLEELGYEVDTRLRPFGEKGELVFTLSYLEKYLKETARTWERLAFTRFRFLVGDGRERAERIVREFLFKKPFNREVLNEILSMRERLEREFPSSTLKYAPGGVVDLEFVSYIYQLYSKKWLRHTLESLKALSQEEERFSKGEDLYRLIRQAETEKRLFSEITSLGDKINELRKEIRSFYREFVNWMTLKV